LAQRVSASSSHLNTRLEIFFMSGFWFANSSVICLNNIFTLTAAASLEFTLNLTPI